MNNSNAVTQEQKMRVRRHVVGELFQAPVSPADSLTLVTGYDAEGWPIYKTFAIGDRVIFPETGRAYTILAFSITDEMAGTPLMSDGTLTVRVAFNPEWPKHVQFLHMYEDEPVLRHKDALS